MLKSNSKFFHVFFLKARIKKLGLDKKNQIANGELKNNYSHAENIWPWQM